MAITDAIKLRIYNGALRHIGDRKMSSLTDARESRRVLDDAWGSDDDIVKGALELGDWNFAMRAIELAYTPSVEPTFGFRRVFNKPDDIQRLSSLAADEYMKRPLTDLEYQDEGPYWLSDFETIYVRYVSDDLDYGRDDSRWPEVFKKYLELFLASEVCERLTNSKALGDRIEFKMQKAVTNAKSHDAMKSGTKFFPQGSWTRARGGGSWRDKL